MAEARNEAAKTIKGIVYLRALTFDRSSINEKERTVEVSFSSETPAPQFHPDIGAFMEVIDHSPGAAQLDRLRNTGSVLVNHDEDDLVGTVESVSIGADKVGRALLRFGRSVRAEEIWQDVTTGIRKGISMGYRVIEYVKAGVTASGMQILRALKWEPFEISLVPIPADASLGVGRSTSNEAQYETIVTPMKILRDPSAAGGGGASGAAVTQPVATPAVTITAEQLRTDEFRRAADLRAIATRSNVPELKEQAEQAILKGTSVADFQRSAFELICQRSAEGKPIQGDPSIGMSKKELKTYSLLRAIRLLAENRPLDGVEKEASDAVAKQVGKEPSKGPRSFYVPYDVQAERRDYSSLMTRAANGDIILHRDMGTTTPGAGGYMVPTNLDAANMIELLRNRMVVVQLGARSLSGLTANLSLARQSGGATAAWLSETGTLSLSDQTLEQLNLTPKRLAAGTNISRTLLIQGTPDVENFVRQDLMAVTAIEKDRAAIAGSGVGAIPTGILAIGGTGTVTFSNGASPTWAEIIAFESSVANANADVGALAYLVSPTARGKLKATAKAANQAVFIWERDPSGRPGFGEVNGYTAVASKQITEATNVLFGNWNDLIVADFAGVEVIVDPYSNATSSQIRVIIEMRSDIGIRHAGSFCKSTNAIT